MIFIRCFFHFRRLMKVRWQLQKHSRHHIKVVKRKRKSRVRGPRRSRYKSATYSFHVPSCFSRILWSFHEIVMLCIFVYFKFVQWISSFQSELLISIRFFWQLFEKKNCYQRHCHKELFFSFWINFMALWVQELSVTACCHPNASTILLVQRRNFVNQ